jgi:antitoxin CcdA
MEVGMPVPARKQHANLSIRGDLLSAARSRRINLSQVLEERLDELLREQDRQAWLIENRAALDEANAFVERHGLWSDGLRGF